MASTLSRLLLAAAVSTAAAARAQEQGAGPDWYGYQTLMVDAAAVGAAAIAWSHAGEVHAGRPDSPAMIWGAVAAAGWLVGPPLVHVAQGRTETAAHSFSLRLVLPLVAALAGGALYAAGWGGCTACLYAIPPLAGVALLTPIVADAAVLSRRPPPPPVPRGGVGFVAIGLPHGALFSLAVQFGP